MTLSSDWKMAPVSLRIDALDRRIERRDVDLVHCHHRLEGALGALAAARGQLEQVPRGDLPREAPTVLAPAAHALLAAVTGDRIPVVVGLFLAVGQDHEAHGLVGLEVRTAVEGDERPSEQRELDGELVAFATARVIGRGAVRRADMAVGEGRGIEFRGLAALAFVEPDAGHQLVGHCWPPSISMKKAPCGSVAWTIIPPPGTSTGPNRTSPPPERIASMLRSRLSTRKQKRHAGCRSGGANMAPIICPS